MIIILCVGRKLIDHAYTPFHAVLRCGNLASDVQVFPRPEPVQLDEEVDPVPKTVLSGSSTGVRKSSKIIVYKVALHKEFYIVYLHCSDFCCLA